ncbi:MAG: NAD(P)/FAD-dependent oxidoreductase [Micromonosporaceae bacterium]
MSLDAADVVVVGGGIVGVSAAYALKRRGFDVVLLEQRFLAYGASGRNSGCLWIQTMRGGPALELARRGAEMYPGFVDVLGPTFEYRRNGGLFFYETQRQRELFQRYAADRERHGVSVELVEPDEARKLAPALPDSALGAAYCPDDAQLSTAKFVRGLGDACRRMGVRVHESTPVLGLTRSREAVTGVRTVRGDVPAQAVVWTTGAWAKHLEAEGLSIPINPVRVGLLMTQPVHPKAQAILRGPLGADSSSALADLAEFRPGEFPTATDVEGQPLGYAEMVSATAEGSVQFGHVLDDPDALNPHTTILAAKTMLDTLLSRRPDYAGLGVTGLWSGLVAGTPDGLPVIDRVDDLDGLHLATGHSFGNAAGPISGELVAQSLAGEEPSMSLAPFALSRPALSGCPAGDVRLHW